jgi:hypothetical protein
MGNLSSIQITWDEEDRPVISVNYADNGAIPEGSTTAESQPEHWLEAFAERLTDKSAMYLRRLIEINEADGFVSLAHLAHELGVDKKETNGWNRNLGRSIKATVREYGFLRSDQEDGTAQLFDFEWDQPNNRWLYSVPEKFRTTLVNGLDARVAEPSA